MTAAAEHQQQIRSSFSTFAAKFNFRSLLHFVKHYSRRIYVIFWHELSMDPAVRKSPYDEPPANEVVLTGWQKRYVRITRVIFLIIHIIALYGFVECVLGNVKLYTLLWTVILICASLIGSTAGAHRFWSHRSYKATWQMRLLLMIMQTLSVQYNAYNWARDHRLHHKYSDTDADPHNSNRGFFFSHIGWLLVLRHPEVNDKIKTINMKDIEEDEIIMFQKRYYVPLAFMIGHVIPTLTPWYFWSENFWKGYLAATYVRHIFSMHCTFLINSIAHMYGMKPYDKNIRPVENKIVSFFSFGDGWHNYHHVFPWDYRNAELWDYKLNLGTLFIDFCAKLGWAYDLKTVPPDVVVRRVTRTGDKSYRLKARDG